MSRSDRYVRVAVALLSAPDDRHWGADLRSSLRMRSGALYPILWEMLDDDLVEDGWVTDPPEAPKGRERRYYRLTDKGRRELAATARAAHAPARKRRPRPRPAIA